MKKIILLAWLVSFLTGQLQAQNLKPKLIDDKYGFVDKTGKEVVSPKYDYASYFKGDLAKVRLNNKYGFIDNSGKEVIPLLYEFADDFSEGLVVVKLNGKYGFIDKTGKETIPFQYDYARSFWEGLAAVRLNNKWCFIDKARKEIIPFLYDHAESFDKGLAAVKLNGKFGFIDKTGKEIIPFLYDKVRYFEKGLAAVALNNQWGFIDKTGNIIVPCKYDDINTFSDGLAAVKSGWYWGYIDSAANQIIPFRYDKAYSFVNGRASVTLRERDVSIDKSGSIIYEKEETIAASGSNSLLASLSATDKQEAQKYLRSDVIIYTEGGRLGLKTTDGKILTHPHFSKITFEKSPNPSMEDERNKFLYHLTSYSADIWYQPYQEKNNPFYIVGYTESRKKCINCNGTGEMTINAKEQEWEKSTTSTKNSLTDYETHYDISSGKYVRVAKTRTSTTTSPGGYRDKTVTKTVTCDKCKNGTTIATHNYTYDSYNMKYTESVSQSNPDRGRRF